MSIPDLRHRGSKGGVSIDMDAHESTRPLLDVCPTPVSHEISNFFTQPEPLEADHSKESPVPRRLVVMFDGTSNMRNSLTNVSRFFEAIDDSKPIDYKLVDADVNPDETTVNKINGIKDDNVNKDGQRVLCSTCQREDHRPNGPFTVHLLKGPDGACPECNQPALKRRQLLKYVKGVGTNWGDGIGLAFGTGLSHNVKVGYKWLVNQYRDGDEIFVFGFSRGAFSARSLVSLLHRCGGLPVPMTPEEKSAPAKYKDDIVDAAFSARSLVSLLHRCGWLPVPTTPQEKSAPAKYSTDDIVDDAYAMYQAFDPKHPSKSVYLQKGRVLYGALENDSKKMQRVTVAMLGVWDTVGAVGIRSIRFLDTLYYYWSSRHYEFHDQDLPCIVEHAYHALAIDEQRSHFAPTLWTVPRLPTDSKSKMDEVPASTSNLESVTNPEHMLNSKSDKQIPLLKEVKQVWFMGSHCNVGGGADLDDLVDPDDLWLYSYVWMQKHAEKLGLRFYWTFETPAKNTKSGTKRYISLRKPESSYKNFLGGWYQYLRLPFYRDVTASINAGAAKLHWSVVKRIKVDGVKLEQERIKAEQERIKAEQKRIKAEQERIKAEQELDADKAEVEKFEPYRPESLFKERHLTPEIWTRLEWIWFKLTVLLGTLGFSKPVQDDSKLEVDPDGKITVSGEWKWPPVEFDDLKTVEELKDQDLKKEQAASKPPVAKLEISCNCHSKQTTEFQNFNDTRWLLQRFWDCCVNWWPL